MSSIGLAFILVVITVSLVGKTNTTDVSISQETKGTLQCDGKLRLRCSYNGSAACCTNVKLWSGDESVLIIGTEENSKYTQEVFSSLNYFNLVINKLEISDLDKKYSCQYITEVSTKLEPNGIFHCSKCGGFGFLWILIGVVVAYLVCVIIVHFKVKWNMEKIIVTSVVSIFFSLLVSAAIAVPVCIVESLCLDSPRLDPLFILLGLAVELGLFFILGMCIGKSKGNQKEGINSKDTNH